jgi:hypothetical protein
MNVGLVCPNGHPVSVDVLAPAGGRFYCSICGWKDDETPAQDLGAAGSEAAADPPPKGTISDSAT